MCDPHQNRTFLLLKFSEGAILTLWFSLHLDLCLDSALYNCVLCGRLTLQALIRACADVSSCWLPWFGAPRPSSCWLLEGPCDPLPCTCCIPLVPSPCAQPPFFLGFFILNPAYLRTAFPIFPEQGLTLVWGNIAFCSPSQCAHLPCHSIGCFWAVGSSSVSLNLGNSADGTFSPSKSEL